MSGIHRPELPRHLLRVHVGLLLAMEGVVSAAQSLRVHVCDGPPLGCSLCRLADLLAAANRRLGRMYDRVEASAEGLVETGELDVVFERVRELLNDPLPPHLAGLRRDVQRTHSN